MKSTTKRILALFCVTGMLGGVGCLAPETEVDATEAEDPVFTVTVVDLDQGGIVVAEYTERLSEQIARRDLEINDGTLNDELGRTADAIYQWSPCNSTHLRIYDQTFFTGNSICFGGYTGVGDLANWGWENRTRSFTTGSYPATFTFNELGASCGACSTVWANSSRFSASCEATRRYFVRHQGNPC